MFLWKAVCSNMLLSKVEIVLFMNKCDILDAKLRSGIRLSKYLRSFGDRPNDLENAIKCEFHVTRTTDCADHFGVLRSLPWEVQFHSS